MVRACSVKLCCMLDPRRLLILDAVARERLDDRGGRRARLHAVRGLAGDRARSSARPGRALVAPRPARRPADRGRRRCSRATPRRCASGSSWPRDELDDVDRAARRAAAARRVPERRLGARAARDRRVPRRAPGRRAEPRRGRAGRGRRRACATGASTSRWCSSTTSSRCSTPPGSSCTRSATTRCSSRCRPGTRSPARTRSRWPR